MWLLNDFEFRLLVKKDNTITYLFILTFLIALTVSIQMPILSLFMTKIIGVNPMWTGLFFGGSMHPCVFYVLYFLPSALIPSCAAKS